MLHLNLPFLLLFLLTSPIFASAAITCLEVNSTAIATWTNARGQTCRWTGKVGGNFGVNAVNGGMYVPFFAPFFCFSLAFSAFSAFFFKSSGKVFEIGYIIGLD